MTQTTHGHHIPGSTTDDETKNMPKAKCGGIGICKACSREAARAEAFQAGA